MSDPSILLLLTCVTCADSSDNLAQLFMSDCSTVETAVQPRNSRPLGANDCPHSVSPPEAIPAFLTAASQSGVTVQTTAMEGAIAPPEPFILPETFTKPPITTNAPRSNQSPDLANPASAERVSLLRLGSRGEAVSQLQQRLQQLGHYTGAVDGVYGQLTFAAVTQFQQAEGLTVDGIAGPATWSRLRVSATSTAPLTPLNRELTARLSFSNASESTPKTTTESSPNQSAQTEEAERLETASTAGETAGNAPPLEESQTPQVEKTDQQVAETDVEQSSFDQESQQAPEFVFDTSPSGIPFYFWIGAWAIVYVGGMLFIFKDSIISKLGLTWGKDDIGLQDIQLPMFGQKNTLDQFASALDYGQALEESDGFGTAMSNASQQEKQDEVSQHDSPLYFSREVDSSSEETQTSETPNKTNKPPIFSLLEKLAYESPRLSNQELTPVWADGGVVEPIRGLFSDLPHPLGGHPSERRRNKAIAPPPPPSMLTQFTKHSNQAEAPSTLIATLPAEDPETNNSYTYSLLDNAEGYFLLKGNELRIYDAALVQIESDVDHTITLRRTDAKGAQVDKSFVVNFTKADDDAEMARSA
jgi:hypothetical protein